MDNTNDSRRLFTRLGLCALVIGAGYGAGMLTRANFRAAQGVPDYKATVRTPNLVVAAPKPLDHPLSIPAQRARGYEGGNLTIEAPMGAGPGYTAVKLSYPSDGFKIYTQAVIPTSPKPVKGYPVVILVHGYVPPDVYRTEEGFYTNFAAQLARKGFLVLKPDLRGFGDSWGTPDGAYFSPSYVADVLNLRASIPSYKVADSTRVGLMGHSMGGYVALKAIAVAPERFRNAVILSGAVGATDDMFAGNWRANSDFSDPVTMGTRSRVIALFGEPNSKSEFWRAASPYSYLRDIQVPIQVQYAVDDDTVPSRFSEELVTALRTEGRKVEATAYDHGGHSLDAPDIREQVITQAAALFGRSL